MDREENTTRRCRRLQQAIFHQQKYPRFKEKEEKEERES
jgi:hypothetical protein